ncbi:MAG: DUF1343 domain-containing protein [Lachnospiraceae bacterium]|nr:DUF1343 domain-containing protein [Lachnospiraceae bacterium]
MKRIDHRRAAAASCRLALFLLLVLGVSACGSQAPGAHSYAAKTTDPAMTDASAVTEDLAGAADPVKADPAVRVMTDEAEQDSAGSDPADDTGEVILGDEQFDEYLPLLAGKRVALFSNHTGIVGDRISAPDRADAGTAPAAEHTDVAVPSSAVPSDPDIPFGTDPEGGEPVYGEHILDALLSRGVDVTLIFCPEHGFRGTEDAGASVDDSVDERTGIPILSLYGDSGSAASARKNTDRFDILVADMQDVGLRYYTYYLTLYSLMDVCSAAGREVLILDRPNPNGFYVDGPILQEGYRSGVGRLPIPVVYGMTWGELAQMINGEGWLSTGRDACDLTVIPCRNYTHQTLYSLIRRPSPNLKDMRAVYLYASTCFFENTAMSVGRGTDHPFEIFGSPQLAGLAGYSFSFTPESMPGAQDPPFRNETCYGADLRTVPIDEILENGVDPSYLVRAYRAWQEASGKGSFWGKPDRNGIYWIDRLSGSDALRIMVEEGKTAEEIKASWQDDIRTFREQRKPYLLYEDNPGSYR